jgi:hypothetical protein
MPVQDATVAQGPARNFCEKWARDVERPATLRIAQRSVRLRRLREDLRNRGYVLGCLAISRRSASAILTTSQSQRADTGARLLDASF